MQPFCQAIRCNGARDRTRTGTPLAKQGILNPRCLPFHHPGGGAKRCVVYPEARDRPSGLSATAQRSKRQRAFTEANALYIGAGNEARTRDLNLGKVALYQLSYSRMNCVPNGFHESEQPNNWRRGPESNRTNRICNPGHNRFATAPCLTKKEAEGFLSQKFWSGKRGSNSRPQPWQGCALPTELFPHCLRLTQMLWSCNLLCCVDHRLVRWSAKT